MFIAIFHMAGERFVDWIPVDVFQMDDIKSTKQSNRAQQAATCEKWNLLFKPPLCPWCMKNRRTPNKNHMWIFRIFIRRNKMLRRCHDKMNNKPAEKKIQARSRESSSEVPDCVCYVFFVHFFSAFRKRWISNKKNVHSKHYAEQCHSVILG